MYPAYTHWAHWSHLLSVLPMYPACAWWVFGSLSPVLSSWQVVLYHGQQRHKKLLPCPPPRLSTWRFPIAATKLSGCTPLWGSSDTASSQFQSAETIRVQSSSHLTLSPNDAPNILTSGITMLEKLSPGSTLMSSS